MPVASTVGPLQESLLYVALLLNKVPVTRHPGQQLLCHCGAPWLATSSRWLSATAPRPTSRSAAAPGQQHLPDGSSLQRPCQQLRHGAPASCFRHGAPASQPLSRSARPPTSSRWLFAAAPSASSVFPMELHCKAPAGNKPHRHPRPATNLIRRRKVLRFG